MSRRPDSTAALEERLASFLALQQRIVSDFERSLGNARHFIDLAGIAIAREPEETAVMLEQVRDIDLLRHVSEQFESFEAVAAMLAEVQGPLEPGARGGVFGALRQRYEALVREAEDQAGRITAILGGSGAAN